MGPSLLGGLGWGAGLPGLADPNPSGVGLSQTSLGGQGQGRWQGDLQKPRASGFRDPGGSGWPLWTRD